MARHSLIPNPDKRITKQPEQNYAFLQLRNRYLFLLDLFTLPLATLLAFAIRLSPADLPRFSSLIILSMVASFFIKPAIFRLYGLYAHYWPFAGFDEALQIAWAALLAEFVQTIFVFIFQYTLNDLLLPRSIPFLDLFLTLVFFAGPRFGLRWRYNRLHRNDRRQGPVTQRVLIAGAGEAGFLVAREIQQNPSLGLHTVGFVDDDPEKQRLRIYGVTVLGPLDAIPDLIQEREVSQVLIAIPSAPPAVIRQIVEFCHAGQAEPLILPGMSHLVTGRVELNRFRKVQLEDLLAREPICTDISGVRVLLHGRRVVVTGAGGSIGSELCRQIARCNPAQLVLLGHGENSIFAINNELQRDYPALDVQHVIGDIRDERRLEQLFQHYRPQMIFHAAAHKHVPLMEANPEEAVTNNVLGTRNLLAVAERHGVEHFVMISTDKAVRPTSVMGVTKRIAEQLVQITAQRTGRAFVAVRFGNVLGSRGSVVPFFQQQIEHGGPVTVTHPDIKRYFMTIPEAVQLVLQAATLGENGDLFVLDMGEPVKIVDLARDLIRLAGLREGQDIRITFTGLRPGEKLYEELFLENEHYHRTAHEKIFVAQNGYRAGAEDVMAHVESLIAAAWQGDRASMHRLLCELVPEYQPFEEEGQQSCSNS